MHFLHGFLVVTFIVHAAAFTILAIKRAKKYYFLLTGTFLFLTMLYILKFKSYSVFLPGSHFPLTIVFRICAISFTLAYLITISRIEGTWLRRLIEKFRR